MTIELGQSTSIRCATIDVVESRSRSRRADYICVIGQDLTIDPDLLSRYCIKDLDPIVDDLVLVAGAVAFTDRVVPRKPSIAWRRNLEVSIPVHEPERWRAPDLQRQLIRTLDCVTGDNWTFSFKHRRNRTDIRPQAKLPLGSDTSLVMPYSDGLDSFSVARLVAADNPGVPLVLITTGSRRNRALDESNSDQKRLMYRVAIPFHLPSRGGLVRHREPSYRSRAFVFGVMAGIAAHLLHANDIFVAESGQGALGPWLTPVGNEAPDVRMHPSFTAELSLLFSKVFGARVTHVHRQLWKTKGETLKEIKDRMLADGWWLTSSCARDQRHVSRDNGRIQCGICAGCLLRRQSLHAAGLRSDIENYLWDNLSEPTLSRAVVNRHTAPNDERQALCAVLEMQQFADLSSEPERLIAAAAELSPFLNEQPHQIEVRLGHLIAAHAAEWQEFRLGLGPESFINRWLDTLK